ncbi:hypothetical protein [Bacillus coahuilensis]|nr:hypothetical protein [Bacillus coahuilensis]
MKRNAARFILFIFFVTACGTTENGMEQSPQFSNSSSTLQVKGV